MTSPYAPRISAPGRRRLMHRDRQSGSRLAGLATGHRQDGIRTRSAMPRRTHAPAVLADRDALNQVLGQLTPEQSGAGGPALLPGHAASEAAAFGSHFRPQVVAAPLRCSHYAPSLNPATSEPKTCPDARRARTGMTASSGSMILCRRPSKPGPSPIRMLRRLLPRGQARWHARARTPGYAGYRDRPIPSTSPTSRGWLTTVVAAPLPRTACRARRGISPQSGLARGPPCPSR